MDSRTLRLDVAVDTGGTFTDIVGRRSDGKVEILKVPSTPHDPSQAVLQGLKELQDVLPGEVAEVKHGTTVATNGLLENKGARSILITNQGFEDLLDLRRQNRPGIYDLCPAPRASLIPRSNILGFRGRMDHLGNELEAMENVDAFMLQHAELLEASESIGICFLYGHINDEHERSLGKALQKRYPKKSITLSSLLSPLSREYERAETVAANAFIAPIMSQYIRQLENVIAPARLTVMDSSGGRLPAKEAIMAPVKTALSGPAGGVRGAWEAGRLAGFNHVIGLDIGGTSTDVSIARGDLAPQVDGQVGDIPLRTPMLQIETVGAGGGSIAFVDAGGALRVGPQSAGSIPGPAAYGRAGPKAQATVTDANVVLNRIPHLLGGAMALDREAAFAAVQRIATQLNVSTEATAQAIIQITEANMVRACKNICMAQGVDPRQLALVAFGGAGGLHGCAVAQELGIQAVVFPANSGVLSAVGIGMAPLEFSSSHARYTHSQAFDSQVILNEAQENLRLLLQKAPQAVKVEIEVYLDCRLAGQSHDLAISLTQLADTKLSQDEGLAAVDAKGLKELLAKVISNKHQELYGWRPADHEAFELTAYRIHVRCFGADETREPTHATDETFEGPRVVPSYGATLWLPPQWEARTRTDGAIVCRFSGSAQRPSISGEASLGLEIHRQRLTSIAEEMGAALMRSSYSANIKERRDFSCALFDRDGNLLMQAAHIPVHLGSQEMSVKAAIENVEFKPDSTAILNDPFQGGTHLPDVTLVSPVFIEGRSSPDFYVANRAHHADVGGVSPGSMPAPFDEQGHGRVLTIHEEGFRIAPSLLTDAVRESFIQASRTPSERSGDLRAQEAANHVGVRRIHELVRELGSIEVAQQLNRELLDYAESRMRSIVASIPDGTKIFEDYLDSDGLCDEPLLIRAEMTISGERATIDFSESADSCDSPLNAVRAITLAATYYAFRCLAPESLPSSGGIMRPLEVITRKGSICDAVYPAAVSAGNVETSQRLVDVILGALGLFLPNTIPAASCGSMNNVLIGGSLPGVTGSNWVHYETLAGGSGGGPNMPGANAIHTHMTNTLNTPIEEMERLFPLRVKRYSIRTGKDTVSLNPGGRGIERHYQFAHETMVTLMTERRTGRPYGLNGGEPGVPGQNQLVRASGKVVDLPGKISCVANAGDTLIVKTPGGGGWGKRS